MTTSRGIFLSARWQHLAMASWIVDPALLRDVIPAGTELDTHEQQTYVSLVGFRFLDTRVLGWPIPGHRNFDEVNLRFYLRRKTATGWERGVSFIRELVPRRAIAWVARTWYNEPYQALPMTSTIETHAVTYGWRTSRWNRLRMVMHGDPFLPDPASRDGWIAEHYWGWTKQRDGSTIAYRVEHPPWRIRAADAVSIDADLEEAYGSPWGQVLTRTPDSAFVADGSAITVSRPVRVVEAR
ncbi:MAG: DUF2071 domain-containing protein [Planctomycetota bacterium]